MKYRPVLLRFLGIALTIVFIFPLLSGAALVEAASNGPDHVVINEFIATPTSAEAVELYNPTANDVDVSGWSIDGSTINAGQIVPAGGYLVLSDANTSGIGISNAGEVLELVDANGVIIDQVAYGSAGGAPKPFYNTSTGRAPDGTDTDNDAADFNWTASPTLGAANDQAAAALGSSVVINEVDPNAGSAFIELYNPTAAAVDLGGWMIAVDDDYWIPAGESIPAGGFWVLNEADFPAYFSLGASKDNVYLYDATGVRVDQIGWSTAPASSWNRLPDGAGPNDGYDDATSQLIAMSPTPGSSNAAGIAGSIVINEIMQNPAAVSDSKGEWFELYNATSHDIDLNGWTIKDNDSDNHVIDNGGPLLIAAGDYLVLGNNADTASNGGVSVDYSYGGGWYLSNSADEVILVDNHGIEVDRVEYDNGATFPDPTGASMALIAPILDNNIGTNWCTASTPYGDGDFGTPGAANDCPPLPGAGDILINEFIATPTAAEAVELCNTTDSAIDVGGWVLDWGYGNTALNDDLSIPAHGYLIVDDSNTAAGISISNNGTVLTLKNVLAATVDQVGYGNSGGAPKPEYNFSTARVPDCTSTGSDANDWNIDPSPTLGAANDGPAAKLGSSAVVINEVDPNSGSAFIELYNSGADPIDLGGWRLSVDDSYDIPAGQIIPPGGFWTLPEAEFPAYFKLTSSGDNVYLFNATLERVDQVGWDMVPGSSWNRLPDGAGANDGYQQVQTPLFAQTPTPLASNLGGVAFTFIHDVQGASHLSPLVDTDVNNIYGIVTVVRSRGFYLQTPDADVDADPATSEGIYVYTGSAPAVAVGDGVLINASVTEYYPGGYNSGNLSTTELTRPNIIVINHDNPLPTPTLVGAGGRMPPNQIIENDATGDVNTTGIFDPDEDGIDFYESLEGMLVQINDAVAVGPTNRYGEIPVVGDGGAYATIPSLRGGVVIQPGDFNPERIIIDDAIVSSEPQVIVGDTFTAPIVGVMDYSYGNFKLLNFAPLPDVIPSGLTQEVAARLGRNQLRVATFNVENLDPGDDPAKLAGLGQIIAHNLQAPDIIGLEEIQDNTGPSDDGVVDASATYAALIAAIQAAGGPVYDYRDIPPLDNQDGGQPGANIRVGFLFRPDRVRFVDRPGGDATTATEIVDTVTGPHLTLSPGRVDPNNPAFAADPAIGYQNSRKSLAAEFRFNGQTIFVVVNHFKSKGGDDPLFGRVQPPVLNTEAQRIAQAQVINDFADQILASNPKANIIVLGDLNDFDFSPPLTALKGGVLTNVVETLPRADRYSFIYNGNSQQLDHLLISPNLAQNHFLAADIVHVNADFAASTHASDHDPVLAIFEFPVWRFRGRTYQGQLGDTSQPLPGVSLHLYGRNSGDPAPGTLIKSISSDASGFFNFYILKPWMYEVMELTADAPADMVASGVWSADGTVVGANAVEWTQPAPAVHMNALFFTPTSQTSNRISPRSLPTDPPTTPTYFSWLPIITQN
ncbi:MAG: hypothetical protein GXP38_11120 [Chloroflexi bacterium]|nr:hypothetical protein [Chloroflexota bacterium]